MDMLELMKKRHSVRQYIPARLHEDDIADLQAEVDACNVESGLNIQLVTNEPQAFKTIFGMYMKIKDISNYLVLIGDDTPELEEKVGYYGERLVLKCMELRLSTCWMSSNYKQIPGAFTIKDGERLVLVIALGYGKVDGFDHDSRDIDEVSNVDENSPDWFVQGVEAALLAPTARNQQKFYFELLDGNKVKATAKSGYYTNVDLGIAKYHFEVIAGKENFTWA